MESNKSKWLPFFYPNNCFICRKTDNLKRCSRCQMISYCASDHQKEHWPVHKEICKQISIILKERKISHVYENLRGADSETWRKLKFMMYTYLQSKLGRPLHQEERGMFLFPRTCFICHEAKQKNLKKCPGCPYVSFCSARPSSSCHDQVCSLINDNHQFQTRVMNKFPCLTIARAIETIVINTRVHAYLKLPTSVQDYLYRYAHIPITVPEDLKISASIYFSKSLTLFSALQKLNYNAGSKMVLHVIGELAASGISFFWEVLLHLLPNLIDLKIILIEHAEDVKYRFDVCQKCRSMKKTLDLESVSATYNEYVISEGFTKPDIVAMYNLDIYEPPEKENMLDNWDKVVKNCGVITCPWFLTVATEKMVKIARKKLRSHLKNVEIFYEGKNDFTPIKPELDWESEGVCWLSTFLMIMKPRDN